MAGEEVEQVGGVNVVLEDIGGGQGRVPIFRLPVEGMEPALAHRPDPDDELHGFIEPSASMPLAEYETAIGSTRPRWRRA